MIADDLIIQKLETLHEHKMAKEIFVPILKKIKDLKGVKYTGGTAEEGIDVEYYQLAAPDGKRKYTGIQFKKGNLKYGAGGAKGTVKEVKNQAEEAFEKDIHALDDDSTHKLSRFICAVTREINENARKMIAKAKKEKGGQIDFWDGHYLCKLIRENWMDEFLEYFNLTEEEIDESEEETGAIVDASYIEENYTNLVRSARSVKDTVNGLEWMIIFAVLKKTSFDQDECTMADVLFEIGKTEDYINEELNHLKRLEYLDFESDGTIRLSGKAAFLQELGNKIVEEIVDAEESPSDAEKFFDDLID